MKGFCTSFLNSSAICILMKWNAIIYEKPGMKDPYQDWQKLSELAPDAYSFILNLMNGNNEWADYQ